VDFRRLLLALALFSPFSIFGQDLPPLDRLIPRLELSNGRHYENARIVRVEADAAIVSHAGGVARVPLEAFDAEWREALGYDPEAAAAARRAETERRNAAIFPTMADSSRTPQERRAVFKVVQVLDEGLLVSPHSRGGSPGSMELAVASLVGRKPSLHTPPRTDSRVYYLRGDFPDGTADGEVIEVRYLATDEVFRFETVLGSVSTVSVRELVTVLARK